MKKIILLSIVILFGYTALAQKKTTYGIGLDVFQTQLIGVNKTYFSGIGHAEPGFIQNDRLGWGATYLAVFPINKKINLETGIGISHFRSQFQFEYVHRMTGNQTKKNLNINLLYAKIPLMLSYNVPITSKSKLNIAGGFNVRLLFGPIDNYQKIIFELYTIPSARYKISIVSPNIALGYEYVFKDNRRFRLEANAGFDFNSFTNSDSHFSRWGFYENLATAHYTYYGMSIKYFFTK
jgi:hypothetical protein